jgi:FkbM family methyltransferase
LHGRSRKALRALALRRRLQGLRRRALATPRYLPGRVTIDGLDLVYDDLLSLYMEYKHIFAWGIYDFSPRGRRPRILDCGSHLGLSVLRFKRLEPACRVTAFEPDATVLGRLRQNLQQNAVVDVEIVPAALAGARGTGHFVGDGADGGRLAGPAYAPPSACEVPTVPLADYLAEPVDFLKMNIEGAECEVLLAAADRLHNVRQMVVEYHGFPECGQRLHEVLALLDACGFRYLVHHFDYETNGRARPPFRLDESARFFQLIAATRLWDRPAGRRAAVPNLAKQLGEPGETTAEKSKPALEPKSRHFGFDRGTPVDRHYIEVFLRTHQADVRGRVLEVGDSTYTRRFGGPRVTQRDVLNLQATSGTTVVADLARAENIADATYDCFILTQTLPFIYDVHAALQTTHRILKPGGVLLLTVPGISQLSRYDAQRWGDYWRFTPQVTERLLAEVFGGDRCAVRAWGNLRAATALLDGRAADELQPEELSYVDADYPVLIAARAVR